MKPRTRLLVLFLGLLLPLRAFGAVGDESFVSFAPQAGAVPLAERGAATTILVDNADWPGVIRAAGDLASDVQRVAGVAPELSAGAPKAVAHALIVGTVGRSPLIDGLVRAGKLDAGAIAGRWEAFTIAVVDQPLAGVGRAVVIAGSDKRGTIYGIYEVSQQIGVSPWYWWADVPVAKRDAVYVKAATRVVDPGPVVQYRGIFINDEAPALTGWAQEKFGGFNHRMYAPMFELLLRLRANYLWPAMWLPRAFIDDDPENARLADEYGIVLGTSHHEPLMRAHDEWSRYGQGPWNYAHNDAALREFWRGGVARVKDYEKIVTIGMRGDGDEAMSEETNVALLERIVHDQRQILTETLGRPAEEIPQLWALYKEVQGYYERGMRVPDDVILLWCDDNWGNIRRLPTPEERRRPGGAGVYYHFDYVGGPRNYKWLNTVPISKVWEQMHLAWQYDANRIWIVNVGDLKPMEFPIEFFLNYAWNPARWPYERLDAYSRAWAAREFGPAHAAEVAALINGYTRLNGRRKPEMLAPDMLSLVNYGEAERVVGEWRDLVARAEKLQRSIAPAARDAYFQLVLYPVKASANAQELYVAAGRNRLYTRQGRAAANTQIEIAREHFSRDAELVDDYHALGGGRWNHMMSQIKFGYTYWQTPDIESMPPLTEVRAGVEPAMAIAIEGAETAWPSYGAGRPVLPALDAIQQGTRWIEVFNRGRRPFTYKVTPSHPWVKVAPASGTVDEMVRLKVSVDWDAVPLGDTEATLRIEGSAGGPFTVALPVRSPEVPAGGFDAFVVTDNHLAIEAPQFDRAVTDGEVTWKVLPDFGRTQGGVAPMPVLAAPRQPGGASPRLEYATYFFDAGEVAVELHCAPSLDFQPGEGLQVAVSFDDEAPQVLKLGTWTTLQTWEVAVAEGARKIASRHTLKEPGRHILKVWMVTPGVVLQRIVVDARPGAPGKPGGVRPSYLGPPATVRAK
ncbi:MAG: glycosyl hydrolase 115 family protein [Opitutaceae bacterium]|nr:glycosyl hydrolase 115 family protein [Opitutaceae bacterium]